MKTKISLLVITIMALSIGNLYSGEWIVKHQFNSPTNSTYGLAWDGTYLWLSGSINMIYKLDPVDGNVITQFPINVMSRAEDLAWDGEYLWVCDKMSYASPKYLHKIDTTAKQIVESLAIYTLGTNLNGLTFCEGQLAAGDGGENIYFVNPETGQLENTLSLPPSIEPGNDGLTWDNVHLWLSHNNGTIFKLNKDNGEIVDKFEAPSGEDEGAEGLAWDGSYIWYADNTEDIIYQMELLEGCLPEGITFNTQAQIDSFQVNYPGCTEIEGDVIINGDDISNLTGLNVLIEIGGDLLIGDNYYNSLNPLLTNLTGLDNLTSIGGGLIIQGCESLTSLIGLENLTSIQGSLVIGSWLSGNLSLNNLSGLDNLTSIGGDLYFHGNPDLTSLTVLHNLTSIGGSLFIYGCQSLTSLTGLENITSIPGGLNIGGGCWSGGWSGSSLLTLTGLENLTFIGGEIHIENNPFLTSLTGLDNVTSIGGLTIVCNYSLANLTGLENVSSIAGFVYIGSNPSLINLIGLDNVTSIEGGLKITDSDSLTSLTGLNNLNSIAGNLTIGGNLGYDGSNIALTDISSLGNLTAGSINNLEISYNISLSNCDVQSICDYLASPNGTITIQNNAPGCNSPEEVQDDCNSITSVSEIITDETFTISPNPLESTTIIAYSLHQNSPVILKILDLSGREMITLVDEVLQQGEQRVVFNTAGLPAGVYFCMLKTNNEIQTRKMIKL